jgi:PKHD-type hydroxylase
MLLQIPSVLTPEQVKQCRNILEEAEWIDGRVTAGHQSSQTKYNMQLPEEHEATKQLGALVLSALERQPLFMSAALPLKVFPPLFNRYQVGQSFGTHVDNAIRQVTGTPHRVRTDLSATLFFSEPEEYEGGELIIEDTYGVHSIKLPAGHMILYPSTSLHNVTPVTKGTRLASFFWIQSMIRDSNYRSLLFDLDIAIQRIANDVPTHPSVLSLTCIYHNLLRCWADV